MYTSRKKNFSQFITNELSKNLTTSKRRPLKKESDRGTEFFNSIFQLFLISKNLEHFSRFADKNLSIAERVIRSIRNL